MSVQVNERTEPSPANRGEPIIRVRGLKKYFPITQGILFQRHVGDVHAVDGVDLEVYPGETIAVDGVVRGGTGFVSEAAVSGEPFAVVRRPGDRVHARRSRHLQVMGGIADHQSRI